MIEAGEDPRFIARRLVILASEDIGLADPTALPTAVAAAQAVQLIGMPEARLNLAQATIALALAPKSNAVIKAIDAASRPTCAPARSGRCRRTCATPTTAARRSSATAQAYTYSHDEPYGIAEQQYAPDVVAGRRVLPADLAGRRGRGQGALGAGPTHHPGGPGRCATRDQGRFTSDGVGARRPWPAVRGRPGRRLALRVRRRASARVAVARSTSSDAERGAAERSRRQPRRRRARRPERRAEAEYVITDSAGARDPRRAGPTSAARSSPTCAARDRRQGGLAGPRRAPGAGAGDPQPDPVRDAPARSGAPASSAGPTCGRPAASGRRGSAPRWRPTTHGGTAA